jgi:hypothetical protein
MFRYIFRCVSACGIYDLSNISYGKEKLYVGLMGHDVSEAS